VLPGPARLFHCQFVVFHDLPPRERTI